MCAVNARMISFIRISIIEVKIEMSIQKYMYDIIYRVEMKYDEIKHPCQKENLE